MKKKLLVFLLLTPLILTGCAKDYIKDPGPATGGNTTPPSGVQKPEEAVNIIDIDSNKRNYAIMVQNHFVARPNHSGLEDAYIVYEMLVEGGITRFMAIYQEQTHNRVGSVRSSRPYYLDYVLEHDAIYAHIGGSDQALSEIKQLGLADLDGMALSIFYRDKSLNVALEHTAFMDFEDLKTAASNKGLRTTREDEFLLNYLKSDADLSSREDAKEANKVKIVYSDSNYTNYEYDTENGVYNRFVNGKAHSDGITKNQYTAENIITYKVKYTAIDSYGRLKADTIGSGTGYYITNGYAVPITWSKASRSSQTVYKYKDGTEIDVSDGNTWIQIQPTSETLIIE